MYAHTQNNTLHENTYRKYIFYIKLHLVQYIAKHLVLECNPQITGGIWPICQSFALKVYIYKSPPFIIQPTDKNMIPL